MKASLPPDEAQRLKTLRGYDVLDTPPEQLFDDLTLLAAHICQTTMASVSLVDESRQWFKSRIGVTAAETSRDIAFCAHTILHKGEVFEVRDAEADPRFLDSPLVTADPHIRFYAGAPLIAPDGQTVGALCVMDRQPRALTTEQLVALSALSRQVVSQLELRRQAGALAKKGAELQRAETLLRQQFDQLSATKNEADLLLALAQKSRRALLSVIEDEKLAGKSLRESEERFRQLAENINEVFWMTNPAMTEILYVSPAYEKIWGRSCESLYASPRQWLEVIHPEDQERIVQAAEGILKSGVYEAEYRIFLPDKTMRWIHDRGFIVRNAAGEVYRIVGTAEDITQRKGTEGEVRWKTAFLEAQVDSSLDGILVVDDQGKIILKNQRLSQLFKISDNIVHGDKDEVLRQQVINQIKSPKQFAERVDYLYGHPDEIGRDEIELVSGAVLDRYSAPVRDKAGEYYGRIWTFRDITEQRKLEAQFRQSQKMEGIGQLAGGVAHDFNNMLAVIQMHSDLLKSAGVLSADQSEFADEIGATVQRAAALTRQLLLFSRREVFQPRDLDLTESITNTTKMLRRTLGETVQMQLKLASQPMFTHADAGMIDQVLLNLAVNARDAMPNGGQLVIETSGVEFDDFAAAKSTQARPGSFVCLSVSDSGCGIPPEILPKIFEPFFTTKDVGKGTGLGLATVFGIAQQHQGWVDVYSELSHGTTFRMYLPRLARNGGPKSSQTAPTATRGGNETILLVEDDPSLRASVRKALAQLGYRILEAPTGVTALEVWKQNRDEIRLLLTDLVMPDGMTGKELAQHLLQENPKLKVIYMSGYSAEVVGKNFPLMEGDNFLTKPFQSAKLAQIIRDKLDAVI
jgi:two-component system cell cycle sensor histidine kinase/response regulator CckA